MKLTELNPRWVGYSGPIYDGISFDCPHCLAEGLPVQRLAITFSPPIDPNGWWPRITQPTYVGQQVWKRISGDTFENLTLNPSVNTNAAGHWHGFITNGEAV